MFLALGFVPAMGLCLVPHAAPMLAVAMVFVPPFLLGIM